MWTTRLLQFVWFPTTVVPPKASALYTLFTSDEFETFQQNASPSPQMPFLSSASGFLDGMKVTIQVNHGRVDLLLEAGASGSFDESPSLEYPLNVVLKLALNNIADKFLDQVGPVTRLAILNFGTKEVASYKEAAEEIFAAVNLPMEWDSHSDLIFQINKRKQLSNELEINRLMQFAVAARVAFALDLGSMQGTTNNLPRGEEKLSVSFNLDLNTVPSGVLYQVSEQKDYLKMIASELVRLSNRRNIKALSDEIE